MSRFLQWLIPLILLSGSFPGCGDRSDTIVSIALHPTKSAIVYIATDEAVYKSRNAGETWKRLNGELQRTRVITLAIDPRYPANIYAGTNGDGTYKSPDGGRNWHQFTTGLQKGTISAIVNQIVFHPLKSEVLFAATTVGVFQSSDGGRTWRERMGGMTEINFVVSLAIDPVRPHIMYAGTTGGVFRTKNAGDRWVKVTEGMVKFDAKMASMALGVNSLAIHPGNPDVVYAGTTQGLFKSENQGNNWAKITGELGEEYVSAIQLGPPHSDLIYLATSGGVWKSADGGQSWKVLKAGLDVDSIRSLRISPMDPSTIYLGTNGGGLYRSIDGGLSWKRLPLTLAK